MNRIKTIAIEDEPLARKRLEKMLSKIGALRVMGIFENPQEAMGIVSTGTVDLILSDIQMPGMDGITFLRSLAHRPFVIFITGHPEFAAEGFELDVLDYIMKPLLTEERLLKAIDKAKKAISHHRAHPDERLSIKIKDRNRTLFVVPVEILYVKAWGDYVQIYTVEGIQTMHCKMMDMENILPWNFFVRIHRSHIVNIQHIKSLNATKVTLKNGEELGIGPQYRTQLYTRMGMN